MQMEGRCLLCCFPRSTKKWLLKNYGIWASYLHIAGMGSSSLSSAQGTKQTLHKTVHCAIFSVVFSAWHKCQRIIFISPLIHQKQLFPFPAKPLSAATACEARDMHREVTACSNWNEVLLKDGLSSVLQLKKHPVNPSRKLYVNEPFIAAPGSSEPLCFNVLFNNF